VLEVCFAGNIICTGRRNKTALKFAFLMGVLGATGLPLWNGYISKTLLHESIVEYIRLFAEYSAQSFVQSAAGGGNMRCAVVFALGGEVLLIVCPCGRKT
jgi:formate hydrogenlyase subunit 3/multisubunit Na+/H+ antiporter MnhD subunit